ncbi:uncharacterized protein LOC117816345 [Xyrichtys novacula]|uniref:Uncharacterized protein LOC117816345 n=1 Tax=Xyrichtys novacula TaxID=13765 RepID=A0AAV1EVF2_XYRNO|nr:uncharacterized protein LOC117816345 [Xyrichtys novacula]
MASLGWMALTLTLLLAVGNSLADTDPNELAGLVKETLNRFRPSYIFDNIEKKPMFSLAVSIPYDEEKEKFDVSKVEVSDEEVKKTMLQCKVHITSRVVAATVLRWPNVLEQCPKEPVQWRDVLKNCGESKMTWLDVQKKCSDKVRDGRADHAEYRALKHMFKTPNKNDFLLFYVLASPCDKRCANPENPWNILESIKEIKKWKNYAVVFSNVFQPRNGVVIPEEDLKRALEQLGKSVGLKNIFRCSKGKCESCSDDNKVTSFCVRD